MRYCESCNHIITTASKDNANMCNFCAKAEMVKNNMHPGVILYNKYSKHGCTIEKIFSLNTFYVKDYGKIFLNNGNNYILFDSEEDYVQFLLEA
jgi:hypothetical protein